MFTPSLTDNKNSLISHSVINALKAISVPFLVFVGPIIALVGMIISLIMNSVHLGKSKSLHKQKVKQIGNVKGQVTEEQLDTLKREAYRLKISVKNHESKMTQNLSKWGERLIPGYFAGEVASQITCKKVMPPKTEGPLMLSPKGQEGLEHMKAKEPFLYEEICRLEGEVQSLLSEESDLSQDKKTDLEQAFSALDVSVSVQGAKMMVIQSVANLRGLIGTCSAEEGTVKGLLSPAAEEALENFCARHPDRREDAISVLLRVKDFLFGGAEASALVKRDLGLSVGLLESSLLGNSDAVVKDSLNGLFIVIQQAEKEEKPRLEPLSEEGKAAWSRLKSHKGSDDPEIEQTQKMINLVAFFLSRDSGLPAGIKNNLRSTMALLEMDIKKGKMPSVAHKQLLESGIETVHEKQSYQAKRLLSQDALKELGGFSLDEEPGLTLEQLLTGAGALLLKRSTVTESDKIHIKQALEKVNEGLVDQKEARLSKTKNRILPKAMTALGFQIDQILLKQKSLLLAGGNHDTQVQQGDRRRSF